MQGLLLLEIGSLQELTIQRVAHFVIVYGNDVHQIERVLVVCTDIFNSIFATGPAVALIVTLLLDNTIPGTRRERGLHVWQQLDEAGVDWWEDDHMNRVLAPADTPPQSTLILHHSAP